MQGNAPRGRKATIMSPSRSIFKEGEVSGQVDAIALPGAERPARINARVRLLLATVAVLSLPILPATAADITAARYDREGDEIVIEVVYRGTNPDHRFTVQWGRCHDRDDGTYGVAGRLIDAQGDDVARDEFRVRDRIGLDRIPCRPAEVTLRLGAVSLIPVSVPAAPEKGSAAGGAAVIGPESSPMPGGY